MKLLYMVRKDKKVTCFLILILAAIVPINNYGYKRYPLYLLAGRKVKFWERTDCARGIAFFRDSTYREYVGEQFWEFNSQQDMFRKIYIVKDGLLEFYCDINPLHPFDSAKIIKLTTDSLILLQNNSRLIFVRAKNKRIKTNPHSTLQQSKFDTILRPNHIRIKQVVYKR